MCGTKGKRKFKVKIMAEVQRVVFQKFPWPCHRYEIVFNGRQICCNNGTAVGERKNIGTTAAGRTGTNYK